MPDHQHDVFVSYAHVDNMPFPGTEKGWVSLLVETLEILLAQKLGRREGFSLWMDRDLSRHKQLTPEILNSLSDTATLVVILSPGYLASEWCLREKDTFLSLVEAKQEAGSRVFIVERDQVEWGERPTEFGDLLGYRFWVPGEGDGTPLILGMPFPDPKNPRQMPYFDELTRLACNLADELKELRTRADTETPRGGPTDDPSAGAENVGAAPPAPAASETSAKGTVLLAEVTDDLDARNTALRTFLEQAGFEVLPDSWYPRDPEGFRRAVDADLARSAVFVQLLSTLPGKRPPGLEEGYVSAQHTQALAAGKPVVQWRHPDLDVAGIEDEAHRGLLERETVMAVSVDELQREIVRLATPEAAAAAPSAGLGDLVFVNAEAGDMELAQQVSEALEARGLSCALPLPGGTPAEVREDLESNLMFCDALMIIQGTAPSRWVRDQLLLLRKVAWKRDEPLRALALYEGPPADKEPLRFGQPGLITLNARAGMDDSTLAPLVEALQDSAGAGGAP